MEAKSPLDLLRRVVTDGKISFYYFSDLTSPITALHHLGVPRPGELNPVDLSYRWRIKGLSEDLIDAVWGGDSHSWVENSDKSQLALIAKLQASNVVM